MTNLEQIDISGLLSTTGDADKVRKRVTSPAESNYFNPAELDATGDYIDEQLQIAKSPGFNLKEAGLSEDAFFPGRDTPVTQQGYSGKTFSAPTIAATGGLFPYAVLNARQAEEKLAKQKLLDSSQFETPGLLNLADISKNPSWHKKQEQDFMQLYDKGKELSMKHHGTSVYAGRYVESEKQQMMRDHETFQAGHNEAWEMAMGILSDDTGIYNSKQIADAESIITKTDDLLNNDYSHEAFNKYNEVKTKMLGSYKNVDAFTTQVTTGLKDNVLTTISNIRDVVDTNGDYDLIQTMTGSSPFIMIDDKGKLAFDDTSFNSWADSQINEAYKGRQTPFGDISKSDIKKQMRTKVKNEIKPVLKNIADDKTWEKLAAAKQLATHKAKLKKKEKEVEVTESDVVTTNIVDPETGTEKQIKTKDYKFPDPIFVEAGTLSYTFNPASGKQGSPIGNRPFYVTAVSTTVDQDKNAVLSQLYVPVGDRITTKEFKEGKSGYYVDKDLKIHAQQWTTEYSTYRDVEESINKSKYTLSNFPGVKGKAKLEPGEEEVSHPSTGKTAKTEQTSTEWNDAWTNLKAGESMVGLDGKPYTKQ